MPTFKRRRCPPVFDGMLVQSVSWTSRNRFYGSFAKAATSNRRLIRVLISVLIEGAGNWFYKVGQKPLWYCPPWRWLSTLLQWSRSSTCTVANRRSVETCWFNLDLLDRSSCVGETLCIAMRFWPPCWCSFFFLAWLLFCSCGDEPLPVYGQCLCGRKA